MKTNWMMALMAGALATVMTVKAQTPVPAPPPTGGAATPRISFAKESFDFGKINSGDIVKHDFVFTNMGNAVLEITEVRPSCGCTTAGTWDKRVEPGKTGI